MHEIYFGWRFALDSAERWGGGLTTIQRPPPPPVGWQSISVIQLPLRQQNFLSRAVALLVKYRGLKNTFVPLCRIRNLINSKVSVRKSKTKQKTA